MQGVEQPDEVVACGTCRMLLNLLQSSRCCYSSKQNITALLHLVAAKRVGKWPRRLPTAPCTTREKHACMLTAGTDSCLFTRSGGGGGQIVFAHFIYVCCYYN